MGKILSLILGTAAVVLGIWGLVAWWQAFLQVLKGVIPVILILGGGMAVFLGIVELKDSLGIEKEKAEETREEPAEASEEKAEK